MTMVATCPRCAQDVESGNDCECGYLRMSAAGQPHTQHFSDPEFYRPQPTLPGGVRKVERKTTRGGSTRKTTEDDPSEEPPSE